MLMYKILLRFPRLFKYINQVNFLNSLEYNQFRDYFNFMKLINNIYNYSNIEDKYFINVLIEARNERNFDCAYRFKNIRNLLSKHYDDFIVNNKENPDSFFYDMITISKYLKEDIRLKLALELLKRNYYQDELITYFYNKIFNNLSEENKIKIKSIKDLMKT